MHPSSRMPRHVDISTPRNRSLSFNVAGNPRLRVAKNRAEISVAAAMRSLGIEARISTESQITPTNWRTCSGWNGFFAQDSGMPRNMQVVIIIRCDMYDMLRHLFHCMNSSTYVKHCTPKP